LTHGRKGTRGRWVAHGTATGALAVWQLTVAALGGQRSGDWEHEEENAKRESSLLSSQRYRQARGGRCTWAVRPQEAVWKQPPSATAAAAV
jgi:hypothetical protein